MSENNENNENNESNENINTKIKYNNGLFIFRRDFRIIDNKGLNLINSKCKNIFTCFIFTPEQVGSSNKFKSNNSVEFMIESLEDLSNQINKEGGKLITLYGHNNNIINNLIDILDLNYICFNEDYSPYALKRDFDIIELCKKKNVIVETMDDYYLTRPGSITNVSGNPYVKFTPYYNTCLKEKIESPTGKRKLNLSKSNKNIPNKVSLNQALNKFTSINLEKLVNGGRNNALKMLKQSFNSQKNYSKTRNLLAYNTSLLSAYIKFGCISIREVYKVFKGNKEFIRQLFWRDFYAQILYNYPNVLGSAMKPNYNKIKWHYNEKWFNSWKNGETGFPIIDACMRQLNNTGYMHNRGRLIVASFLIKILLIDWKKGEEYFAKKLTDYDVASNNLNWQWCASTGIDSEPYFRIINPWLQSQKNDPNCEYIKKWVPELQELEPKIIHNWNIYYNQKEYENIKYFNPICDYKIQKEKALKMYKEIY